MTRRTAHILRETIGRLLAAAVSIWLLTGPWPAFAQEGEPVLREQIDVYLELVTLGDLFENAGSAADIAVFRSPDIGTEGVVASKRVAAAARQHGLIWRNPGGIEQVVVRRPSRVVSADEITRLIRERVSRESGVEDQSAIDIRFSRHPRPFQLDARVKAPPVIKHFELEPRTGAFRAAVTVETTLQEVRERVYQGRAQESQTVPVPARNIERGATIAEEDMRTVRMSKRRIAAGAAVDMAEIVGMAAKRPLTAGRPVRRSDLERPRLVRRNTLVTIVYRGRGLLLKAQGRAQADGAAGETIAVLNTQSNRTVQARVDAPGVVSIGSAAMARARLPADPVVTSATPRKGAAPAAPRGSHAPSQSPPIPGRQSYVGK